MSSFENTLERMKNLYTYGKELNESSKSNAYTLEHSAVAADGKTYGIIRECNKFYIKSAQKGKERIAESYEYIGGFCNKKNYEYTSYNNALKNFELKMASINEACDGKVNISTLDPFKKGEFIVEGTDKMRDEIARQRQIMFNVAMLMNEGTEIGASRKDNVVMNRETNPEAENGKKGDIEGSTTATAKPDYTGSKTKGVNKKVAPFNNNTVCCNDQLKESCECGEDNCNCDWGTEGIGKGRDPKKVGWDIEGQQVVNEEDDWGSEGLPSTPGVGEADSSKNNMPFNKTVNEEDVDNGVIMETDENNEIDGNDFDSDIEMDLNAEDDLDSEEDVEFDDENLDGEEDIDFEDNDEFDSEEDMDFEDGDEFNSEEDMDFEEEDDDILTQIEKLQAQIDSLRAQIDSENVDSTEFDDEVELDSELDSKEDMDFEDEDDFDTEDEFDSEEDMDFEDDDEFDSEEDMDFNAESDIEEDFFHNDEYADDEQLESLPDEVHVNEVKRAKIDSIIESVVNSILNEDELHAFGKHPGYQKKPMELPTTGEDKNQWGEDWNDESVYSEEPYGTKIGYGTPYEKMVDAISKTVMSKLSESIKNNKKKVK